jgi:hypothetical protein
MVGRICFLWIYINLRVSGGTSIIGKDLACEAVLASIVHEKTNVDQAEEIFLTDKNKS